MIINGDGRGLGLRFQFRSLQLFYFRGIQLCCVALHVCLSNTTKGVNVVFSRLR